MPEPVAQSVPEAESRSLRGLVVGLGSIGRRHAANWEALGLGPLRAARDFPSLAAALAEHRPNVVLVTNPTSLHVETACAAVEAGADVLIEKPLSHSLHGVAELIDLAAQRGRKLAVGYNLRFHPGLQRLRELVQRGGIGRPLTARAEVGEYLPEWHPWEDYRQSYSARRDLGGGPVLTLSHDLDALCWVLGRPTRIVGLTKKAGTLEIQTEDAAELALQFLESALGSVHVDYLRREPRRFLEVSGEDGILHWEYGANRLLQYAPCTREWRVEQGDPRFTRNDMFLAELSQLRDWIGGAAPGPLATVEQAAAVLAIALAGLQSSETGQAIDLSAQEAPVAAWLARL
jgi:predicted dehydrogenase